MPTTTAAAARLQPAFAHLAGGERDKPGEVRLPPGLSRRVQGRTPGTCGGRPRPARRSAPVCGPAVAGGHLEASSASPGSEGALLHPRPLRTEHATLTALGSSKPRGRRGRVSPSCAALKIRCRRRRAFPRDRGRPPVRSLWRCCCHRVQLVLWFRCFRLRSFNGSPGHVSSLSGRARARIRPVVRGGC